MLLTGEGKPLLTPSWRDIATAPKDRVITVGFASLSGRLMGKKRAYWFESNPKEYSADDCPANWADWKGWADDDGHVIFPSHWDPAG